MSVTESPSRELVSLLTRTHKDAQKLHRLNTKKYSQAFQALEKALIESTAEPYSVRRYSNQGSSEEWGID